MVHGQEELRNHTKSFDATDGTHCLLRVEGNATDAIYQNVSNMLEDGDNIINYVLIFPEHRSHLAKLSGPDRRGSLAYKNAFHSWKRTSTRHQMEHLAMDLDGNGLTRLLGIVNYHLHNYLELSVPLADDPTGCFAGITAAGKIGAIKTLLMNDFLPPDRKSELWREEQALCHVVMIPGGLLGNLDRRYWCYTPGRRAGFLNKGLDGVNHIKQFVRIVSILFLLCGPWLLYTGDAKRSVPYTVNLDEEYRCQLSSQTRRDLQWELQQELLRVSRSWAIL